MFINITRESITPIRIMNIYCFVQEDQDAKLIYKLYYWYSINSNKKIIFAIVQEIKIKQVMFEH